MMRYFNKCLLSLVLVLLLVGGCSQSLPIAPTGTSCNPKEQAELKNQSPFSSDEWSLFACLQLEQDGAPLGRMLVKLDHQGQIYAKAPNATSAGSIRLNDYNTKPSFILKQKLSEQAYTLRLYVFKEDATAKDESTLQKACPSADLTAKLCPEQDELCWFVLEVTQAASVQTCTYKSLPAGEQEPTHAGEPTTFEPINPSEPSTQVEPTLTPEPIATPEPPTEPKRPTEPSQETQEPIDAAEPPGPDLPDSTHEQIPEPPPALMWSQKVESGNTTSDDIVTSAVIDSLGNVYIVGQFGGTLILGQTALTSQGLDAFVAALDAKGTWKWAKLISGNGSIKGTAIALDEANKALYVTGYFTKSMTFGSNTMVAVGSSDIFVGRLSSIDGTFRWSHQGSGVGTQNDVGHAIAVNGSDVYVGGSFYEKLTFGTLSINKLSTINPVELFVAKFSAAGQGHWLRTAKGGVSESVRSMVATSGGVAVTGIGGGQMTFGSIKSSGTGSSNVFLAEIDSSGKWLWAQQAKVQNRGLSIATNSTGEFFVTGYFGGTSTFGSTTLTATSSREPFVAKLDAKGQWMWIKDMGGRANGSGNAIAVDANGVVYVTGTFQGTIDVTVPDLKAPIAGKNSFFIGTLDQAGNWIQTKDLPTSAGGDNQGHGIAIGPNDMLVIVGQYKDQTKVGASLFPNTGGKNGFVWRWR